MLLAFLKSLSKTVWKLNLLCKGFQVRVNIVMRRFTEMKELQSCSSSRPAASTYVIIIPTVVLSLTVPTEIGLHLSSRTNTSDKVKFRQLFVSLLHISFFYHKTVLPRKWTQPTLSSLSMIFFTTQCKGPISTVLFDVSILYKDVLFRTRNHLSV